MRNKIVHLFRDTDMRNQHDGLSNLARSKKVKLDELGAAEHVVFLNARLNKIKLYSANGVLSYYRAPGKERINLGMVEMIPACFNAEKGMDWGKAERLAFDKLFAKYEAKFKPKSQSPGAEARA